MFKHRSWSLHEQAVLLRQLGSLLEKGYSLLHALEFIQLHSGNEQQRHLRQSIDDLKKGNSVHSIFVRLHFHADVLAYLFYAEQHGNIAFALKQGGDMLARKKKHKDKLNKSLQYPLFLFSFVIGIMLLFNTVLFPQFTSLYDSIPNSSSHMIDILFLFIRLIPSLFLVTALGGLLVFVLYKLYINKLPPVTKMNMLLSIPVFRTIVQSFNSHYFAIQLSSLLQGGLSVLESLVLMEQQGHQPFFQCEAADVKKQLINGEKLELILQQRLYYEKQLSYVVTHGQASGNLAKELADYSELLMERVEERFHKWMLFIQPLLFAAIGIIVVMMYIAILLPMFQMVHSI